MKILILKIRNFEKENEEKTKIKKLEILITN
jgi:hypothetical protein